MSRVPVQRKLVNVASDCKVAGGNQVKVAIFIPFEPSEVIVRQFSYSGDSTASAVMYQLNASNLIGDDALCLFNCVASNQTLDNRFILMKKVNGTFTFQVQDAPVSSPNTGSTDLSTSATGKWAVLLEFVQYK